MSSLAACTDGGVVAKTWRWGRGTRADLPLSLSLARLATLARAQTMKSIGMDIVRLALFQEGKKAGLAKKDIQQKSTSPHFKPTRPPATSELTPSSLRLSSPDRQAQSLSPTMASGA